MALLAVAAKFVIEGINPECTFAALANFNKVVGNATPAVLVEAIAMEGKVIIEEDGWDTVGSSGSNDTVNGGCNVDVPGSSGTINDEP
jgi:hypothetical protein